MSPRKHQATRKVQYDEGNVMILCHLAVIEGKIKFQTYQNMQDNVRMT